MHAKSVLVALAAPALISAAAIPQNDPDNWDNNSEDIVGGVAASSGDFPFIVSLQQSGSHFCGGSLLNANTVLTAGHCGYQMTASSITVRAGSLVRPFRRSCFAYILAHWIRLHESDRDHSLTTLQNYKSGGTLVKVSSIKLHPSFSINTLDSDVAIFKLATAIPTSSTISYATLPASGEDPAAGTTVTVAGWYVLHLSILTARTFLTIA